MRDEVGAHAGEIGAGLVNVLLRHGDCDIAILYHAVVGTADLGEQHLIVLFSEMVQPVLFHGKQQGAFKLRFIDTPVVDRDLGRSAGIQRVKKLRVIQKHRRLIFLSGDAVIDIGKGEGFGKPTPDLENSILPDALDGNGVLYGLGNGEFLFF